MVEDIKTDLISKLKEIFRSDRSDLDFGIYRILNFRRKEIERFIEEDLVKYAEAEFSDLVKANFAELTAELEALKEEINRDFGEGTIDTNGEVRRLHDAPKIKRYIELKQSTDDQRQVQTQINEVFNHVYEFFSRYYDKGDFVSQRRFGGREKYVIPHNGEEVSLYWVNQDQYYIKTSEDYQKYSFNLGDYNITFKLVDAESETNNGITDRFFVIHRELPVCFNEESKRLEIFFKHRPLTEDDFEFYQIGRSSQQNTKFDTIVEENYAFILKSVHEYPDLMKKMKTSYYNNGEKTELKHHLHRYCRKNDLDYFIHKRLGEFLRQELDFYIKNEVLDIAETISKDAKNLKLMQLKIGAIKTISEKIITFLAQIEDFQKKLFEKKKFVIQTDYLVTLDKVPEKLYEQIIENEEQIKEWKTLYDLDQFTKNTLETTNGKKTLNIDFLKSNKILVLDTKHFNSEFKDELISTFSELDKETDGLIIKSENFQALSLLNSEYSNEVKSVYIDPPYNTGSDEFVYKDSYKHSSWLTMMADRLMLARSMMKDDGLIFISIDENELHHLKCLMDSIFGDNLEALVTWRRRHNQPNDPTKMVAKVAEFILVYSVNSQHLKQTKSFYGIPLSEKRASEYKNPDNDPRGPWESKPWKAGSGQSGSRYIINTPAGEVYDEEWLGSEDTYKKFLDDGIIYFPKNGAGLPRKKYYLSERQAQGQSPHNFWGHKNFGSNQEASSELEALFGMANVFSNPKPTRLISAIAQISMNKSGTMLDFFAGSGTTAHAILNLNKRDGINRKFVLVEMGDHFDRILVPRLKKVIFSGEWKNGTPISRKGLSCIIKCLKLEQYEDSLNNLLFSDSDGFVQTTLHKLPDYFLQHVLDVETKDSPTRLTVDEFKTPFDYKIKTLQGREEKTESVDLVETFNYLLGIKVKRIKQHENEQTKYIVVHGEKGEGHSCSKVLIVWRNYDEKILEKEKQFIEQTVIPEVNPDIIYVNVDSLITGAESIEPIFKELMGA